MALNFLNNGYFAGSVGIGTETPNSKLDIRQTADGVGVRIYGYDDRSAEYLRISDNGSSGVYGATGNVKLESGGSGYVFLDSNNDIFFDVGSSGFNFRFRDGAGNELVRIKGNGNVGIGTTNPNRPLHVIGQVAIANAVEATSTGALLVSCDGTSNKIYSRTVQNVTGAHPIDFMQTSSAVMRIASNGNVGIGTTTPDRKLHILDTNAGAITYPLRLQNSGTTVGTAVGLILTTNTSGGNFASSVIRSVSEDTSGNSALLFSTPSGGSAAERMRIDSNGNVNLATGRLRIVSGSDEGSQLNLWADSNGFCFIAGYDLEIKTGNNNSRSTRVKIKHTGDVGIGTTSPSSKLHIKQSVDTIDGGLTWESVDGTQEWSIDANNAGNFRIYKGTTAVARFDSSGNFGIATSTPTQKLHVAGNARVTGAYYDSNNTPGTLGQILSSTATGTDWIDGSAIPGLADTLAEVLVNGNTTGGTSIDVSANDDINLSDSSEIHLGDGADLVIKHDGTNGFINNNTGNLSIYQLQDDGDIKFFCDDGTGATENYLQIDGGEQRIKVFNQMRFSDDVELRLGTGNDLRIYHNNTNSFLDNYTGILKIRNFADDQDIEFASDNGSGSVVTYFKLDGSLVNGTTTLGAVNFPDKSKIFMGAGSDLRIYHDGTDSYLDNTTGDLTIDSQGDDLILKAADDALLYVQGSDIAIQAVGDGKVGLRYNNVEKLATTSTGVTVTGSAAVTENIFVGQSNSTDNYVQVFHSDNAYTKIHGYGIITDRTSYYLRPVNDGTQTLYLGSADATRDWNSIQVKFATDVDFVQNGALRLSVNSTGIYVAGTGTFTGNVTVDSALLSNQENTDVDTGTETVASVAIATYTAAFFDFVIKKTTNVRSGTVYACHDGTNVEFTETSTQDLGDTSDVTLSVDISGTDMRLRATTTSDDWSIKSLIRAI